MFPDDFLDAHEAGEIGALELVHAHDDVMDGFLDGRDQDIFQGIDAPPCGFYLRCQEFQAPAFGSKFEKKWKNLFI